jgi:hypothetical protein
MGRGLYRGLYGDMGGLFDRAFFCSLGAVKVAVHIYAGG